MVRSLLVVMALLSSADGWAQTPTPCEKPKRRDTLPLLEASQADEMFAGAVEKVAAACTVGATGCDDARKRCIGIAQSVNERAQVHDDSAFTQDIANGFMGSRYVPTDSIPAATAEAPASCTGTSDELMRAAAARRQAGSRHKRVQAEWEKWFQFAKTVSDRCLSKTGAAVTPTPPVKPQPQTNPQGTGVIVTPQDVNKERQAAIDKQKAAIDKRAEEEAKKAAALRKAKEAEDAKKRTEQYNRLKLEAEAKKRAELEEQKRNEAQRARRDAEKRDRELREKLENQKLEREEAEARARGAMEEAAKKRAEREQNEREARAEAEKEEREDRAEREEEERRERAAREERERAERAEQAEAAAAAAAALAARQEREREEAAERAEEAAKQAEEERRERIEREEDERRERAEREEKDRRRAEEEREDRLKAEERERKEAREREEHERREQIEAQRDEMERQKKEAEVAKRKELEAKAEEERRRREEEAERKKRELLAAEEQRREAAERAIEEKRNGEKQRREAWEEKRRLREEAEQERRAGVQQMDEVERGRREKFDREMEEQAMAEALRRKDSEAALTALIDEERSKQKKAEAEIGAAEDLALDPRARSGGAAWAGATGGIFALTGGADGAGSAFHGGLSAGIRQAIWFTPPIEGGMPSGVEAQVQGQFLTKLQGTDSLQMIRATPIARYWLGRFGLGASGEFRQVTSRISEAEGDRTGTSIVAGPAAAVALIDNRDTRIIASAKWLPLVDGTVDTFTGELEVSMGQFYGAVEFLQLRNKSQEGISRQDGWVGSATIGFRARW